MAQSTFSVGMDVHKDTIVLGVLADGCHEPEDVRTLPHDLVKLRKYLARLAKRGVVQACYEASGCGYVLQRAMTDWGMSCEVIAPSLIPVRSGDRRKTDTRDAVKLARL